MSSRASSEQFGNNLLTIDPNSLTNAGMIDAAGVGGITIDTGGAPVTNTGTMEATGVGGLLIQNTTVNNAGGLLSSQRSQRHLQSAIITGGTLEAAGSTRFADAGSVVTGAVMITSGGLADFADVFDRNVTFTGAGTLKLAHSSSYGATVSGFASGDKIDLDDLAYSSNETAVWTQANGTLQIYSGVTLEETLHLAGTYGSADFSVTQDSGAGTEVVTGDFFWGNVYVPSQPTPGVHVFTAATQVDAFTGAGALFYSSTPSYDPVNDPIGPYLLSRTVVPVDPFLLPTLAGAQVVQLPTIVTLPARSNFILPSISTANGINSEGIAFYETQSGGNNVIDQVVETGSGGEYSPLSLQGPT